MVDDGYLIGYEDGTGNFVEVGRFNNAAEDTNQPILIEHTASGTRLELDGTGFDINGDIAMNGNDIENAGSVSTEQITGGPIFAGGYNGADPDARLDAALSDAPSGSSIQIEDASYSSARTISKNITIIGTGWVHTEGTTISGDWTLTNSVNVLRCDFSQGSIQHDGFGQLQHLSNATINIGGTVGVFDCYSTDVTFEAGSSDGAADGLWRNSTAVDNDGSNNIGDVF